ncbi:hypothetical protein BDV96DRAFT_169024 [Lophiotrema nucula]|uniref:BTB domain-containing protein n=1 Tax=Lophiotrema nucula TaxID=690887 RepID=A0A6A5YZS6_9PLEO|nr:hypothetical protein BDV96DRAFT_169024 [Lophiotrema nucula]
MSSPNHFQIFAYCLSDVYNTPVITIIAGRDDSTGEFSMHRGLLCFHSEYFRNMLNGGFKERGSTSLIIQEVDVETFQLFFDWAYTGELGAKGSLASGMLAWDDLLKAYLFADYHIAETFNNLVVDSFFLKWENNWGLPTLHVKTLYDSTTEDDPLRKLFVDLCVETWPINNLEKTRAPYPAHFLLELLMGLKERDCAPAHFLVGPCLDERTMTMRARFCERYHKH